MKYIVNVYREVRVPIEVEADDIVDAYYKAEPLSTKRLEECLPKDIKNCGGPWNADFETEKGTSPVIDAYQFEDIRDMRTKMGDFSDPTYAPKELDIMTGFESEHARLRVTRSYIR